MTRIDRLDAAAVLEGFWRAYVNGERHFLEPVGDDPREMTGNIQLSRSSLNFRPLEPFGGDWPGLAPAGDGRPDADKFADRHVRDSDDGTSRIMLVPAARGADAITAVGWMGPCNYTNDIPLLSSVLRSWEERFGARVIEVGFDTLHLTVAAPPVTTENAEHVGSEHFAFCPDIVMDRTPTIREYVAHMVLGKPDWWFWWD